MELRKSVLRYISIILGKPMSEVHIAQSLEGDLGLDSIDRLDLIFKLENHYGVEFSSEQIENVATLSDICNYLEYESAKVVA